MDNIKDTVDIETIIKPLYTTGYFSYDSSEIKS